MRRIEIALETRIPHPKFPFPTTKRERARQWVGESKKERKTELLNDRWQDLWRKIPEILTFLLSKFVKRMNPNFVCQTEKKWTRPCLNKRDNKINLSDRCKHRFNEPSPFAGAIYWKQDSKVEFGKEKYANNKNIKVIPWFIIIMTMKCAKTQKDSIISITKWNKVWNKISVRNAENHFHPSKQIQSVRLYQNRYLD